MVFTRGGFSQVVANAFAGLGFAAEAPTVYEFPIPMFDQGSDLTPLKENIDKVVYGLTKWQPKISSKGVFYPDMVTVQGKDYQNAVDNLNALFLKNMWSDGLLIQPATEERVKWILTGTDLAPDAVVAKAVMPRGGIATAQDLAVALAMVGGRPEYLPVLIAGVQALSGGTSATDFGFQATNSTTCSVVPAFIVNGPIAKQVRLGSGYGLLGPDPQHPAGEQIGRAMRIIQQDLGGAIPGIGTMAIYGGMRATNIVFAEDEEGLPKTWKSLAEDRGFKREQNVLTATPISGMDNVNATFGTKETNDRTLLAMAKYMAAPDRNRVLDATNTNLAAGVALFSRATAAAFADVSGYSKLDVKTFLWKNSKVPYTDIAATSRDSVLESANPPWPKGDDVPVAPKPEQLTVVVAGGDQGGHGLWMQVGHSNHTMVSVEIKLPKNWDALLKQSEADLGPLPAAH